VGENEQETSGEETTPEAEQTVVELDELLVSPGTYFNPQTEVLVVVDDSSSIDQEIFNMEAYEGADWVRVSDDVPVDEEQRDELLESFQTHYHPGAGASLSETALEQGDGDHDEDEDGQDPGRED
jgi:cupin superfamily acireductone dioxygenase involved in methionine salvage